MTLRVTVEIVPFGVENEKKTIHTLKINNVGPLPRFDGNSWYEYEVWLDDLHIADVGHVRENGALTLVYKALAEVEDTYNV